MKIVICLSALIAVALACPTITKKKLCKCSGLAPFIPSTLNIVELNSCETDQLFSGEYYLTAAVPSYFNNHVIKTSLLGNTFPSGGVLFNFYDATPSVQGDKQYFAASYAFNYLTGDAERTLSLLTSAFGPTNNAAIFSFFLEAVYENALVDESILGCKSLIDRDVDQLYSQRLILAVIGYQINDYILFAVLDNWTGGLFGNDLNVFAFTKDQFPNTATIKNIMQDLNDSGIKPESLLFIDQSVDFGTLPGYQVPNSSSGLNLSPNDLPGLGDLEESLLTSKSDLSISNSVGGSITKSYTAPTNSYDFTADFIPRTNYKSFVPFVTNSILTDFLCLNDFDDSTFDEILSGKYYVFATTASCSGWSPSTQPGFFNPGFPTSSLQVILDDTKTSPLSSKSVRMMYDRSINPLTGDVTTHKSLLYFPSGLEKKSIIGVWTESYDSDSSFKSITDIDDSSFLYRPDYSKHYQEQHYLTIVGCGPGYLILMSIDVIENLFFKDQKVNTVYVLTQAKVPTSDVINNAVQDLLQNNIDLHGLMRMSQTKDISDEYVFNASDFFVEIEVSTTVTKTTNSLINYSLDSNSNEC